MQETMYRQCRVERGCASMVTYLPSRFAHVGRVVKLKDRRGNWEDGWRVEGVSSQQLPESYVVERSHDWTRTRKASDV